MEKNEKKTETAICQFHQRGAFSYFPERQTKGQACNGLSYMFIYLFSYVIIYHLTLYYMSIRYIIALTTS